MGPFQDYEEKKSPEKQSPRSRIPRPVLSPPPVPKGKRSPLPEHPFSEEETKECDISSQLSKRTISPNSFSSDDTGCPSSQSASPAKTPSGSDNSPLCSPALCERNAQTKRVRVDVMAEWSTPPTKLKREQHSSNRPRGSEADFSSSSSGSIKTRETLSSSTGKKLSSRSRGTHIRSLPVFRPPGNPSASRDSELYAPFRTPPKAPSSSTNSSSNSSPTTRRARTTRYHSCGDNHGIKPPNPEQYLTPLQQKEVTIRHLRSKLRESENIVHDRESEIEELKGQLGRMREDWIEEECHRVEAQLSLKEARKEIKQLRQVVETMKNSLMEKDKGIQKYFIDINIQNRKLESLLHSMELAQSGSNLDEPTLDYICDSPEKCPTYKMEGEEEHDEEVRREGPQKEMADSGLLANDEMANRTGILEQVLMSTAMDCSQNTSTKHMPQPELSTLGHSDLEEHTIDQSSSPEPPLPVLLLQPPPQAPQATIILCKAEHKEVQTEDLGYTPDLQALLLQLLKLQGDGAPNSALFSSSNILQFPALHDSNPAKSADGTPAYPAPSVTPGSSSDSGLDCSEHKPESLSPRFMEELDFGVQKGVDSCGAPSVTVVERRYWSNSFLVDLVAVAAPVIPTVAWLYSRHGIGGGAPVYNIASLIRGCCIMGLHTLRHVTHGPDI
ncbi:syntabulin isoform X1 [Alosa sapidissima]|uniref:syntabulin isoform X1 n=1 Tax=Alosa sapidissima TaxID=34773 RepID=UPI001C09810C|nr:syntabulin isoform X1 [Alosa sapidissima]XP_041963357.1 syntabulin isoform X1 [Alosa sapidissima]